jgi:DNA-binding NarL/FixJ family response regulator
MGELSACSLEDLKTDKRWRFRAREVREASRYELSPRMCEVFALDEIGRTTEEISEVLEISEAGVEKRRQQKQDRVGDRHFS